MDKDNHAWDSLKYAIMQIPQFTDMPIAKKASHDKRIEELEKGNTSPFEDYVRNHQSPIEGGYDWGEEAEYDDGQMYETV